MPTAMPPIPEVITTSLKAPAKVEEYDDFTGAVGPLLPVAGILSSSTAEYELSFTGPIDNALENRKYHEALVLLSAMRILKLKVDMAVRWRWVRDYGVDSGFATRDKERTADQKIKHSVLIALLRLAGPTDLTLSAHSIAAPIVVGKTWDLRNNVSTNTSQGIRALYSSEPFSSTWSDWIRKRFRIISETPGHLLERPNVSPARYYTSDDDTICLSTMPPPTTRHLHPVVPNLQCLKDVLQPEECLEIIAAAESVGFLPDIPTGPVPEQGTTRGLYLYWVLDDTFYAKLWSRVERFIPKSFNGKKLRGLHRWVRVYRYILGQEYAAHIDGSWTPSGIDRSTGTYTEDTSPPEAKQKSILTFLVYLNDDFAGAGGETTFFMPSSTIADQMRAYPVQPTRGSVLLFPHGEVDEALYHQGTTVSGAGNTQPKYVIRTDVMYDL